MPAAGILGWKRCKYQRPILHSSKSPETSRKSFSEYIKNTQWKKFTRGATPCPRGWGRAIPPRACPLPRGAPGGPPMAIFCYMESFDGKNHKAIFLDETPPPRGGTLAEPIQGSGEAVLPGKLPSRRGKSSPSSSPTLLSSGEGNLHQHLHQHHLISKPQFISCIQFLPRSPGLVLVGCQQC